MRAIALVVTLSVLLSGCAEYAEFRSSPPGAKVYLNDQYVGMTPTDYPVPKSEVSKIWTYRIEMDGYDPDSGILHRKVAPGRIVAAVFTMCITCAFHGFQYFQRVDSPLTQIGKTSTGEAKGSIEERLKQVENAHNKGEINDREYNAIRSKILGDF